MGSYLPDKVFAVCTNQLGTGYKQLTIDSKLRPATNQTVKLGSEGRVFLVKLDKKLTDNFTCKSGWSSGAGTAAFGAGVLTGLAVAAAVATVPIAGWIVGGAIAIGCLFIGLGAWMMASSPTCSEMIGYEESKWVMHHQFVRFDSANVEIKEKHLALVKNSMLICKEPGGVLLPFISESLATQAGENIGHMNELEMGVSAVIGAFSGFMLGSGFGWAALGQFVVWMGIGHYVINPLANKFGNFTGGLMGNETYEKIKDNSYEAPEWWENPAEDLKEITPTDNYDLYENLKDIIGLRQLKELMIENGASKSDITQINEAIRTAQDNGGSLAADKNPQMKEILIKIKNGEFGQEVKDMYTNRKGNMRGMNTEANAREAISSKKGNINSNRMSELKTGAKATGAAIQLLTPFLCAFIGERAVTLGAEIFDQDMGNSIYVMANDY